MVRRPAVAAATALAVVATVALGGAATYSLFQPSAPDTGTLAPVYAQPPEHADARELARGRTLEGVLADGGMEHGDRTSLLYAFREAADPRRMRSGVRVRFLRRTEGGRPHAVEVVLNPDRTVRLDRSGTGWTPSEIATPTTTDTLAAAGGIMPGAGLWPAVVGHAALEHLPRPDRSKLVDRLDKVFQWQIDFSRQLRPGDSYRFVVERRMRPDGSMKSERLLAAELVNQGHSLHAVWFDAEEDGMGSWYDLDGESVRRAFLKKPLEFRRISSRYSGRRYHPVLKRWRAHRGVDYAADSGTPVQATGDGVVASRRWSDTYGRVVDVRHANGFLTRYAHLRAWARGVSKGARVVQGQVIGYVGMTGLATGPHLHYEMHTSRGPVDPLAVDLPAGDPVPPEARERWEEARAARLALLPRHRRPGAAASVLPRAVADDRGS